MVIARATGITDDVIARVSAGAGADGWSAHERLLMTAVDELHDDSCLSVATYRGLADTYDEQQMIDLVFCIGQYHIVSMALNSFRVVRDDGVDEKSVPFPKR